MYHARWRSECRPSLSVISAAFIAFGKSCGSQSKPNLGTEWPHLLVGKDKEQSIPELILAQHTLHYGISIDWPDSLCIYDSHSSRASVIRSRSLESTTKMIPWVFWKSDRVNQIRLKLNLQCLHKGRILSCPPTSQTVKEIFLYSTVSTLKPWNQSVMRSIEWRKHLSSPIVGIVVTISPNLSLYRIVVLPAASRPTMRIPKERSRALGGLKTINTISQQEA